MGRTTFWAGTIAAIGLTWGLLSAADPVVAPKNADQIVFEGTVVDPEGRPAQGAEVRLVNWQVVHGSSETEPLAFSDDQGRFRIVLGQKELAVEGREFLDRHGKLVATKSGFGLAAGRTLFFEPTGRLRSTLTETDLGFLKYDGGAKTNVLELTTDDVPIRGRLIDSEGRGIPDAQITVHSIESGARGNLDAWEQAAAAPTASSLTLDLLSLGLVGSGSNSDALACLPSASSDADGRFVIKGIGRERIASIFIQARGFEVLETFVRTRRGETRKIPQLITNPDFNLLTYYPAEFELSLPGAHPLEGQVTDERTGHPVPNARISFRSVSGPHSRRIPHALRATTDPAGLFRMEGVPRGNYSLMVEPPAGSTYIAASFQSDWAEVGRVYQRVRMTPGIVIKGRATDSVSDSPIRGEVTYLALKGNPNSKCASFGHYHKGVTARTDADGRYQLAVTPGEGILTFRADEDAAYPHGVGVNETKVAFGIVDSLVRQTAPQQCSVSQFHSLQPVDVKPEGGTFDFRVTRAISIRGRVVDEALPPGSILFIRGLESDAYWHRTDSADFVVQGYSPATGRRVTVVSEADNRVGVVDLSGPAPKEITVRLSAGGRIRGRLVDQKGKPQGKRVLYEGDDREAFPEPWSEKTQQRDRGSCLDHFRDQELHADEEGRFEVWGVVPGLKYTLGVEGEDPEAGEVYLGEIFRDIVVAPGQTRDLGDIVIHRGENTTTVKTVTGP